MNCKFKRLIAFFIAAQFCALCACSCGDVSSSTDNDAVAIPVETVSIRTATPTDYASPDVTSEMSSPSPAPTPSPFETEASTPAPTPTAVPAIELVQSLSLPLPNTTEIIPQGQPFCFGGTVKSGFPLLSVSAVITASGGSAKTYSVTFAEAEAVTRCELVDITFPTDSSALTAKVKFQELAAGDYTFQLYASSTQQTAVQLYYSAFKIVSNSPIQLISNNFRNNYEYALRFFGSRDQFMFTYTWGDGRNIVIDNSWVYSHFTYVTAPDGRKWTVHNLAVPYYEKAFEYMTSTYVHVGGTYDSGVIQLYSLVKEFGGTFVSRFVSDLTFVSHHSFGTAVDLNHTMDANLNRIYNRDNIRVEVSTHLVYNGIKEANGVKYYDFTYNGSWENTYRNVPTVIINYLLYELAFYRAGFGWGYYYPHSCDAMHFTCSELSPTLHDTSSRALRKVYSYIKG